MFFWMVCLASDQLSNQLLRLQSMDSVVNTAALG